MSNHDQQYREASFLAAVTAGAYTFQLEDIIGLEWIPADMRRKLCATSARRVREFGGYADLVAMWDDDALGRELSLPASELSPEQRTWHRLLREKKRRDYEQIAAAEAAALTRSSTPEGAE